MTAISLKNGVLRKVIEDACKQGGVDQQDLTVMWTRRDPYRLDTLKHHTNAKWAADQLDRFYGETKEAHWRGLHYAIIMAKTKTKIIKPDGTKYCNVFADWVFLTDKAGKAARWLGYIPFDRIIDKRNNPPLIYRKGKIEPWSLMSDFDAVIPDIETSPYARELVARQSFAFAMFGEKASLEEICQPIAERNEADLYLGTGETSDTFVYQIARDAAADGRPLVVFTLTDCDPSGWQMFISITRKLQAIRDLLFPTLHFEMVPVALTPSRSVSAVAWPGPRRERQSGSLPDSTYRKSRSRTATIVLKPGRRPSVSSRPKSTPSPRRR